MIIPENLLSKMDTEDRKQFGRAGKTLPEMIAKYSDKEERKLHYDYIGFLMRHEFKPHQIYHSPMGKRSKLPPGHPDFLVQRGGKFLYIEFKVGNNKLDPMQEEVIADLIAQGCTVLVLYSYSEAISETARYFEL